MSDPYGQNSGGSNPYGQNPYGGSTPPPPPGGGGYGAPQDGSHEPPKNDGVSIAALVLSFLCCLAPVGLILGFVGLSRTKGGKRKGRGMAIAAIIIGIVMTIITALIAVAVFVFADSLVTPSKAEVGQCVNVDEDDGKVVMYKKDCTEEHDAEIVGVAKVDDDNLDDISDAMAVYCLKAIAPEDQAKLTDHLKDIKAVIEDPNKVEVGDHLVCYVEPGEKLTDPIL